MADERLLTSSPTENGDFQTRCKSYCLCCSSECVIKLAGSSNREREPQNQTSPATTPTPHTAASHTSLLLKNDCPAVTVPRAGARPTAPAGCAPPGTPRVPASSPSP